MFFSLLNNRIETIFGLDIGECTSAPCQNNGTCIDEINRFMCICADGFSGNVCETSEILLTKGNQNFLIIFVSYTDIDDCLPSPCENGGTCTDLVDDFSCDCAAGFTGGTCETSILTFSNDTLSGKDFFFYRY